MPISQEVRDRLAPINNGPMLQDDSLFKLGVDRFKKAISIATAMRKMPSSSPALQTSFLQKWRLL